MLYCITKALRKTLCTLTLVLITARFLKPHSADRGRKQNSYELLLFITMITVSLSYNHMAISLYCITIGSADNVTGFYHSINKYLISVTPCNVSRNAVRILTFKISLKREWNGVCFTVRFLVFCFFYFLRKVAR